MTNPILYFEEDPGARALAERGVKAKGGHVLALESYKDLNPSEYEGGLKFFKFAICSFDPARGIKSYSGLKDIMSAMPVAILTNGDTGATRAAFRAEGMEIPGGHLFDKGNSTFSDVYIEMKRRLGLQDPRRVTPATEALAQLASTGTHRQLLRLVLE